MHISIATSNGKTIDLEVDSDESIHQIKQKITLMEGIPSEQQKLLCADGKLLEDLQTIAEYRIETNPNILLKVSEIKLQIKSIGEANFTVEAELTDTIKDLKLKIHKIKGLSPDDITLSFKGKKLENDKATVAASNLKDKSLLLLVKKTSRANLLVPPIAVTPSAPSKSCVNNCGFFGNPATQDYCSKCFRDLGLNNNNNNSNIISNNDNASIIIENNNNSNASIISNNIIEDDRKDEDVKTQVDTSKCWKCNKKIGIYGFQCRCKFHFCDKHRYNDRHNCSFDYTEFQKANLVVKLEKCVERKLEEI